jgi:hypothetical protein
MNRIAKAIQAREMAERFAEAQRVKKLTAGYRMQRYEVRAMRPMHDLPVAGDLPWEEFVVGWTEQENGGSLILKVRDHPTWHTPKVIDLGEEMWDREPAKGL